MDVATWNVNSLRTRLDAVLAWLARRAPDVVCLQETKCPDELFPRREVEACGYHVVASGEKGLNGVALLSRAEPRDVVTVLPGRTDDEQRRFVAARVGDLEVVNVYVPNGQAVGGDAFFYKLDWLSRLSAFLRASRSPAAPLVVAGDFNVAPDDRDVYDPHLFRARLHCTDHERRAIETLRAWGLVDALRHLRQDGGIYSWFDYRASAVKKNEGMRIDLLLVTAPLAARLADVEVDLAERRKPKPSDHCPVIARFRDAPGGRTTAPAEAP